MLSLVLWIAGCAAGPPVEVGEFREADLVELTSLDPSIRLDIRYATNQNFLGRPVYREARAFLQRPAAEALQRVHRAIAKDGYGLCVLDAYRPWRVTQVFWDETPADKRAFVANPRTGSKHNRGCAVDVTLFELSTGLLVEMPSEFDEFTERANPGYAGGSEESRRRRDYLRSAMEQEGFSVYQHEWWHFDFKEWTKYRVLDIDFSNI